MVYRRSPRPGESRRSAYEHDSARGSAWGRSCEFAFEEPAPLGRACLGGQQQRGAVDAFLAGVQRCDRDRAFVGWVAASDVSTRDVYRGVVEHSVYVDPTAAGKGVGLQLVESSIAAAEAAGIWTIQSSIFPENAASLTLHDHAGFRHIGTRERIALMNNGPWAGQWRDTILVERRQPI